MTDRRIIDDFYAATERALGRRMTSAERRRIDLTDAWLRAPEGPAKDMAARALDEENPTLRATIQGTIDRFAAHHERTLRRLHEERCRMCKHSFCGVRP